MYWIEMHLHTSHGSPDSFITVQTLVSECQQIGIDAVCVCEHIPFRPLTDEEYSALYEAYTIGNAAGSKVDFFPGAEVKLPSGVEYLIYGIKLPKHFFAFSWEDAVMFVRNNGGIIIKSHPYREAEEFETLDGLEAFNHGSGKKTNDRAENLASQLAGAVRTVSSDAHYVDHIGLALIEFSDKPRDAIEMVQRLKNDESIKYIVRGNYIEY